MNRRMFVLAAAGLALAASPAFSQEIRIGSNPVLGSGTFFSGLYDSSGNLTNVPAAATGLNPSAPFTGTIRLGSTFGAFSAALLTQLGFPPALVGNTTVDINNTGPGYSVPSGSGTLPFNNLVSGSWSGTINVINGVISAGSGFRIDLDGPFTGEFYQANIIPGSAVFAASGPQTWTVQGATAQGQFSGATFGGVDSSFWFNNQASGLSGTVISVGGSATGLPAGFFSSTMTTTAVIPLPPAAWAGLGTLGALAGFAQIRRRRIVNA